MALHRYLLNVGLVESRTIGAGANLSAHGALTIVRELVDSLWDGSAAVVAHAVHESDSEPTLIVEIRTPRPAIGRMGMLAEILASRLRQEAIAVATLLPSGAVGYGYLFGPMAAKWGAFNPAYFLLLNGKRAAEPAEVAA